MAYRRLTQLFATLFTLSASLFAQGPQPGDPAFSPIESHEYYSIDLQDLHINLDVPIRSKTGLGTFALTGSNFTYLNSQGKFVVTNPLTNSGVSLFGTAPAPTTPIIENCPNNTGTRYYTFTAVVDKFGTSHPISPTLAVDAQGCYYGGGTATTTDNSGYTVTVAPTGSAVSFTIYNSGGSKVTGQVPNGFVNQTVTDANGNTMSSSTSGMYTDFLNTTGLTVTPLNYGYQYSYNDVNNNPVNNIANTYTGNGILLKTVYACPPGGRDILSSALFPTNVVFASATGQQSTLSFGYEATPGNSGYYTGRLASITLPTGGPITFAYSGGTNGINCVDGTTNTLKRTTPDSTTPWTYVHTPPASGSVISTTTVKDPLGNETDYTFSGQFVVQVVRKSSGSVVATSVTCYNGNYANCASATVVFPIRQQDVYSQLTGQTKYTVSETLYDTYGNVTSSRLYDGATLGSAPTSLLAKTDTPMGTWSDSSGCSAIGNHVNNRPCYRNVFLGSSIVSSEGFSYDAHGNLTTHETSPFAVIPYPNDGSGRHNLYSSASYQSNGAESSFTNVMSAVFNYTNSECNGLLPANSSVLVASYGLAGSDTLTTSETWNCNGGVATVFTDANSKPWESGYNDPFWRNTSKGDPIYNPLATISYGAGGTSIESVLNFGSSTHDTTVYNDSLGRPKNSQAKESPTLSKWDTVSTYYDSVGRPFDHALCANQ